jgi:hypothetical protein
LPNRSVSPTGLAARTFAPARITASDAHLRSRNWNPVLNHASLSYLRRFPIDRLKIDRSFVAKMLDDPADLTITRAIIGLGHTLGLQVVAEGVESTAMASVLRSAQCDELQGFSFLASTSGH